LGEKVPEILVGGNHAKMVKWRRMVSILVTLLKRPDLVLEKVFSKKELTELKRFWNELSQADKEVLGLSALSDQDLELLGNESIQLRE
jgi:tRNA (guanine37-N1)-methyltransferase